MAGGGARPTSSMSTKAPPVTKYRYRRRLPHLQKADAAVFVTFCTGGRLVLPGEARDLVLEHCLREHGVATVARAPSPAKSSQPRIHLYAAVIMPDHVHLLFLPLGDENGWPLPLVDIMQCLKSATAHRINKLLHTSGPVWEEESPAGLNLRRFAGVSKAGARSRNPERSVRGISRKRKRPTMFP